MAEKYWRARGAEVVDEGGSTVADCFDAADAERIARLPQLERDLAAARACIRDLAEMIGSKNAAWLQRQAWEHHRAAIDAARAEKGE